MSAAWEFPWMSGAWSAGSALTKSLADAAASSDATAKAVSRTLADAQSLSDSAPAKAATHRLADTVAGADATAKSVGAKRADSSTIADSEGQTGDLAEHVGLARTDTVSVTDASRQSFGPNPVDIVSIGDGMVAAIVRELAASLADTAAAADQISLHRSFQLSDTVAPSDIDTERSSALRLLPDEPETLTLTPLE
jgi:hypothetical protein